MLIVGLLAGLVLVLLLRRARRRSSPRSSTVTPVSGRSLGTPDAATFALGQWTGRERQDPADRTPERGF